VNDEQAVRLQSTVDELTAAVRALERRVAALEAQPAEADEPVARAVAEPAPITAAERGWRDPAFMASLIGRLALVLGGGFLLRAMTDSHVFADPVGVALAFAFGLVWVVAADRAGARHQAPPAFFHAVGAAMVAFPVLVEATVTEKFHVFSGVESAGILAVLTAGLLAVAWRRRLQSVAWVTVLAALPTSIVLLGKTGVVVPFAFYLIGFGVLTLWMSYALDWLAIRWPVALAADMVVVGVTMRALSADHQDAPQVAILVQLSLLTAYVVSIAVRTLVRGRNVIPFEVFQTAAALVVGFGGAVYVTRATGALPTMLGLSSLVFGAACYGVAFAFIDRRENRGRNVYYYTTLALVLVLVGCNVVLDEAWLAVTLAGLSVVASGLWSRVGRLFMLLHAAAYLVAAGLLSGTVTYCAWAIGAGSVGAWSLPTGTMLVVLGAGAVAALLAAIQPASDGSPFASAPRFAIIIVFVLAAGGCVVGYLVPIIAGQPGTATGFLGVLATVRTVVLALATLVVGWMGRRQRFREWRWLVYPLLVGIFVKMVAQDFGASRPATLFVAMGFYGLALIVAPRLRRLN